MPDLHTPDLNCLDPILREAILRVAHVYPGARLVGGVVRDLLLGHTTNDADIEVFGVPAEELQEQLQRHFPGHVHTVGQAFGVLKIDLERGFSLDVALPRRESKAGKGHTGFLIESDPHLDPKEAARRRDFTINAISLDPISLEVYDPWDGQKDLRDHLLRVVDPRTFQDDPLRVYRAAQFAARFHLQIDHESLALMKDMVRRGDLEELSKERVTEEIRKLLLKSTKPSIGFEVMRELGIIERSYPELHALIDTPQEAEWHPEGNVWIHTMMVIDAAASIIQQTERHLNPEDQLVVMLGALCHDLGKPPTTQTMDKGGIMRIRSLGHEEGGRGPTASLLAKWCFGSTCEETVIATTVDHLKPGLLFRAYEKGELQETSYANAVRKLLRRIRPASAEVLLAVAEADHRGRGFEDALTAPYVMGEAFRKIMEQAELNKPEALEPLLHGKDLIELGVQPGPEMGTLIRSVELARDDGRITNKEEALAYIKERLSKH